MLLRSIYLLLTPVFLFFAALACTGQLANMVISAPPAFVCPTPPPIPTDVMPPPDAVGPGTPTPTPRPTYTPYPTATPYVIGPPDDLYTGDPVDAGNVRFVLSDVTTVPATPADDGAARWIVSWRLAVTNNGATPYEFVPAAQAYVSRAGGMDGVWGPGQAAADEIGLAFDYAAYALKPGESVTVTLAAYVPADDPTQFTYLLDPTTAGDGNQVTWREMVNPWC